jgi:hypothetical protein
MSDRNAAAPEETSAASVSDEIGRTVGSIWQKRTGTRPANISTEFNGDAIRCVIEEGEAAPVDPEAEVDPEAPSIGGTDTNAYRHEANAAVARITKRTVSAFIAKKDKKTDLTTQTFILERIRTKY